jgi:hypothetical protein
LAGGDRGVRKLKIPDWNWRATPLFAALVLVCIFGVAHDSSPARSPQQPNCHQPEKGGRSACEDDPLPFLYAGAAGFLRDAPAVEATATVLLFLITALLAKIALDQHNTARRESRAYIFTDGISLLNIALGSSPHVAAVIKNFGKTPATDLFIRHENLVFLPYSAADTLKPAPRDKIADGTKESLGPGAIRNIGSALIGVGNQPIVLTQTMLNQLSVGSHAIFYYGIAYYKDVFGRERQTAWRFFSGGPVGLALGAGMGGHDQGNYAD